MPIPLLIGKRDVARVLELLVFALGVPLCGVLLFPADPLGLLSGFPWIAATPIMFAARYGSRLGFICAVVAASTIAYPFPAYVAVQESILVVSAVGTLIMSIVVGDAASAWRKRSHLAEAENHFLQHRLKAFSRDYHVLKVSHGQLEEYMAGQRMSLRQALQQLESIMSQPAELVGDERGAGAAANSASAGLLPAFRGGEELMALFAQFSFVQVAGLYPVNRRNRISSNALATLGDMGELPMSDLLLKLAVDKRQVVSIKLQSDKLDANKGALLAVVPIVDSSNHLHAVLAIRDMQFLAFQQRNLNILALLGGYLGDLFARSQTAGPSRPGGFIETLDTVLRFSQQHRVTSTLFCLELKEIPQADELAKFLASSIRGLDSAWIPKLSMNCRRVAILLPLMPVDQCDTFLQRVSGSVQDTFEFELSSVLHAVRKLSIASTETRDSCLAFILADSNTSLSKAMQHSSDAKDVRHAA